MGCPKLTYQPIFELRAHERTLSREAKVVQLFISVDPLAEETMQPYSYANLNPIKYIDPTGMKGEDWYQKIGSGNTVWYDGSRERAGYEKLQNGTNVIDGQTYQLQDKGVFVNLDTGRKYGKGDKVTGPSGFSITSHGAVATYAENMKAGFSDAWNSPAARALVPDKISLTTSSSITAFLGTSTSLSANWITRGNDGSIVPYLTFGAGGQAGVDISADALVGFGVGYYAISDLRNLPTGQAAKSLLGWSANGSIDFGVGLGGSVTGSVGFKDPASFDFSPTWIQMDIGGGASIGAGGTVGATYTFPIIKSQF